MADTQEVTCAACFAPGHHFQIYKGRPLCQTCQAKWLRYYLAVSVPNDLAVERAYDQLWSATAQQRLRIRIKATAHMLAAQGETIR